MTWISTTIYYLLQFMAKFIYLIMYWRLIKKASVRKGSRRNAG